MLWTSYCGRFGVRAIMPLDSPTLSAGSTVPVVVVRPWRPGAVDQRPRQRPWQRHMWRFPSRGLAVAALLGAALLQGHTRIDPAATAWRARLHDASLVAALGATRVIEPRLTGGFAYAPWTAHAIRTLASGVALPSSRLLVATARIEALAQADARPESLRALGVAYLLLGRPEQAIDTLERARAAAPDDPRTLSDLAAVLLTQSAAPEDTWDALRALNYAERAWRLAPGMPEAAFNAALARERLHLRSEARKAWQAVQRLEPGGAWAAEADRHVAALSTETAAQVWPRVKQALTDRIGAATPISAAVTADAAYADDIARRFPQALREYLQEDLLPIWSAARLAGDPVTAARHLTSATTLCAAIARDGDGTCVRTLARIAGAGNASRLAEAHRDFGAAMKLVRKYQYALSERLFASARSGFLSADSPEALWCDVYLAIIEYRASKQADSSARLGKALPRVLPDDKALTGRMAWQLALNDVAGERFTDALRLYEQARAAFASTRETSNVARIDALIAEALGHLGSRREAWERYDRALTALDRAHNLTARQGILGPTWFKALDLGLSEVALVATDEFLSSPEAHVEPVALMDALLTRFVTLWRLGQRDAALGELAMARRTLADIADASMRQRAEAEIDLSEARMFASSDPRRARPLLTRAIDAFRAQDLIYRVPAIQRLRGQASLGLGDETSARDDFLAGVRALDVRAATLTDAPLRASARDQTWPLVTELIGMELSRGRPPAALGYAEHVKRADLVSRDVPCRIDGPTIDERCWIAHLPARLTAVYYVVLERQLAIWVIRPSGITYVSHDITAARLRGLVSEYRRAIDQTASAAHIDAIATTLFDEILRPVTPLLDPTTGLVVVPDDALHAIPFGALRDGRRQRYLIEDHVVLMAPSYSHVLAGERRGARLVNAGNAVVVTSPRTSGPISAALPRLPGAEAEARHMAATLPSVRVLHDADATKSHLRAALTDASILHIASHARVNPRAPWRSYFVLAPDGVQPGEDLLFMWELSALPLHGLQLAVLAACSSAEGPVAAGSGGALSLAHPFLAAGVPSVIASLWPVNDRASRLLFATFYTEIARGARPEDALRAAQLAMLRGASIELRHPASWAPFVAIGSRHDTSVTKRGTT